MQNQPNKKILSKDRLDEVALKNIPENLVVLRDRRGGAIRVSYSKDGILRALGAEVKGIMKNGGKFEKFVPKQWEGNPKNMKLEIEACRHATKLNYRV